MRETPAAGESARFWEAWSNPVLECEEARVLELELLGHETPEQSRAMERAGRSLGKAMLHALHWPKSRPLRILLLMGKGMNAGDALISMLDLTRDVDQAEVNVVMCFPEESLKPIIKPWWRVMKKMEVMGSVSVTHLSRQVDEHGEWRPPLAERWAKDYDLCIDGVFGMSFVPPMTQEMVSLFDWVNAIPIGMRVAVDLPSGIGVERDPHAFRADVTFATGVFKEPLLRESNRSLTGRCRYLDIGLFRAGQPDRQWNVLVPSRLIGVRKQRPIESNKRSYGHLLILGGSERMPGALMMAVSAAVRSGVGLVSVVAPKGVCADFAALVPEAMWYPWELTSSGGLALEGFSELRGLFSRISGVLMGPGMGVDVETGALMDACLEALEVPVVLDADALTHDRIERYSKLSRGRLVITPHRGEFRRLLGGEADPDTDDGMETFLTYCAEREITGVLKGPLSVICAGGRGWVSPVGGPVLARGGSGDILAGLIGGMVSARGSMPLLQAVCRAVVLHGLAGDRLAATKGEEFVRTTELLNHLNCNDFECGAF